VKGLKNLYVGDGSAVEELEGKFPAEVIMASAAKLAAELAGEE